MSEGENKPKPTPSVPPEPDRAAALARKLTGRSASGRGGAVSVRNTTGPAPAVPSSSKPVSSSPSELAPPSMSAEKEAMLASRRAALTGNSTYDSSKPGAHRPWSVPPVGGAPRVRTGILALGVVLGLALLVVGAIYGKRMLDERSPEGLLRNDLLALEFSASPAERDAAFATLDAGAPSTVARTIELLTDSSRAERADSMSQRTIQMVAHVYLLHYAGLVKAPPPQAANEISRKLFEATPVAPDMWIAARDAWRAWLAEQQAKGAVPKG